MDVAYVLRYAPMVLYISTVMKKRMGVTSVLIDWMRGWNQSALKCAPLVPEFLVNWMILKVKFQSSLKQVRQNLCTLEV